MTTLISSWAELVSASPLSGTYELTANLTTTDNNYITINGATINGEGYTITFASSRTKGLFRNAAGCTVNNLTIDGGDNTMASYDGVFIGYTISTRTNYGTFNDCSVTNINFSSSSGNGGYIGSYGTQNSSGNLTLTRCSSVLTLANGSRFAGGLAGQYNKNIVATDCRVIITSESGSYQYGGFMSVSLGNCTYTSSYVKIDVLRHSSAGFCADIYDGTIAISKCYSLISSVDSTINFPASGMLMVRTTAGTHTVTVTDCYTSMDVTQTMSAPYIGYYAYGSGSLTFTRCYHVGTRNTGKAVGWYFSSSGRSISLVDCIVQSDTTDYITSGSEPSSTRVDRSLEGITERLPDGTDAGQTVHSAGNFADNFSSSVWTAGTASGIYPTLDAFTGAAWTGYSVYNSEPTLGVAAPSLSASGSTAYVSRNSAITTITFTNSGGDVSSWSIASSPSGTSLPTGLSLSGGASSATLSGTPTTALATATDFVVTATNGGGSATSTVSIRVLPLNPNLSAPTPSEYYTPGSDSISLSMTNSGDAVPSGGWSISPALPTGMSFNADTGAITGTPAVGVLSNSESITGITYTITAQNENSTAVTTTITLKFHDTYARNSISAGLSLSETAALVTKAATVTSDDISAFASDPTLVDKVSLGITGISTASGADKLARRRRALGLMFARNTDMAGFKADVSELGLSSDVFGTEVLTYKPNQAVDLNATGAYGFYSNIYEDSEYVTFQNPGGGVDSITFTANGDGTYTYYTTTASVDSSTVSGFSDDNTYTILGRSWVFGSVGGGGGDDEGGICLLAGMPVETTVGPVPIELIRRNHQLLGGLPIYTLVKVLNTHDTIIVVKQDALGWGQPSADTYITHEHHIYCEGQWIKAVDLSRKYPRHVQEIWIGDHDIYNIVTVKGGTMVVNGLELETLSRRNKHASSYLCKRRVHQK